VRKENRNYSVDIAREYPREFFNAPLALYKSGKQIALIGCGHSDDIYIFRNGDNITVFSENVGLEYLSLQEFTPEGAEVNNFFDQSGEAYKDLEKYSALNKVKIILNEYCG
jgi:hypothetical protein